MGKKTLKTAAHCDREVRGTGAFDDVDTEKGSVLAFMGICDFAACQRLDYVRAKALEGAAARSSGSPRLERRSSHDLPVYCDVQILMGRF